MNVAVSLDARISCAKRLWLFLDYDGTLADFAPTPEDIVPDPDLIGLLTRLARVPRLRVAIVSGRRLSQVEALVPVPGVLLAGTYGIELRLPDGRRMERVAYADVRPTLDRVKPRWHDLIACRHGFFLEDKGWALALHARFADAEESGQVLQTARQTANEAASSTQFRVLGGHRFLEICPLMAHKGRAVEYLLDKYPWPGVLPVYLGDDDKDEEAFDVVVARGGVSVLVAGGVGSSHAMYHLASPRAAREWLATLAARLGDRGHVSLGDLRAQVTWEETDTES